MSQKMRFPFEISADHSLAVTVQMCYNIHIELDSVHIHSIEEENDVANEKTAKLISETAMRLFQKKGYAAVCINEICADCGIARSTFYSIFSGKDSIVAYTLGSARDEATADITSVLSADNDFERMMLLFGRYVDMCQSNGWELTGELLRIELDGRANFFGSIHTLDDWFVQLVRNCQNTGIFHNDTPACELVSLGIQLSIARVFDWCCQKGAFDLKQAMRKDMESLYIVDEKYRRGK